MPNRWVKLFEDFSNQQTLTVYHNSPSKIDEFTSRPIWASLELDESLAFYDNSMETIGESYLYEIVVKGNFEWDIDTTLEENGIDSYEYLADITSNPSEEELLSYPGTKLFIDKGFDGIIHSDYYQWDPSQDTDVILIFNPIKSFVSVKLMKNAQSLVNKYKKDNNIDNI
jgi:hypothetical protein